MNQIKLLFILFLVSCTATYDDEGYLEEEVSESPPAQEDIQNEVIETDNLNVVLVPEIEVERKTVETDFYVDPDIELAYIINGLSRQLISSINSNVKNSTSPLNSELNQNIKNDRITVADFTQLNDFQSTNWLGQQIAELFLHELHQRGFLVVDYRSTGRISVKPNGGFVLSRDWKNLPGELPVGKVLTGTLSRNQEGVIVNARIINFYTGMIEATAVALIPKKILSGGNAQADVSTVVERDRSRVVQIVN